MRVSLRALSVLSLVLLAGCGGGDDSAAKTVTAPVDNIKKNVEYKQETETEIRKIGNANKEAAEKIIDERMKKK